MQKKNVIIITEINHFIGWLTFSIYSILNTSLLYFKTHVKVCLLYKRITISNFKFLLSVNIASVLIQLHTHKHPSSWYLFQTSNAWYVLLRRYFLITKMVKTSLTKPLYQTQQGDLYNITHAHNYAELLAFLTPTGGVEEINSNVYIVELSMTCKISQSYFKILMGKKLKHEQSSRIFSRETRYY